MTTGSILVVEDSYDELVLLVRYLSSQGYQTLAATSGEEAVPHLDRSDLDLVITDFQLPGMNGLEVARKSLAADPDRPVILMTAFADVNNARQAVSIGLYDFITKPFDLTDFGSAVRRALDHRHLVLKNRAYQFNLERMVEERTRELRETQDNLREREDQYRTLFEANPQPMWVYDLDSLSFLAVNNAAVGHYGYSRDEFLSMTIADIRPPEDIPALWDNLSRTRSALDNAGNWRHRKKDGTIIDVEIVSHELIFDGRRARLVLANDITERVQAEQALRLFRLLIDHTNDAIEIIDPETGRFLNVNEKACLDHGYTRKEYLALTVPDVDPLVAARSWQEARDEVRRSGSRLFDSQHRRKDGSVFPVEVNATYVRLDRDYIFATVRDITERKRAEETLRSSEERFRQLAEHIQEVFWMTDQRKSEMLYISPAYEEVWGRTCQSLYEQPRSFLEAVHPEDRERVVASLEKQSRGESTEEEYRIVRPDGSTRWIYDQAFPIRDEMGQVYRVAGIAEDITERRRSGDLLRIRTEQLITVTDAMLAFLETENWQAASALLLKGALGLTASEYGFIGVVAEGPVLRILAHEGMVWDATINREFYENARKTYREKGYLEFTNFENLFGRVITSGEAVISNDPASDPRSGGLPPGHPPLRCFIGIPILRGTEVAGMIGVANRPGGYTYSDQTHIEVLSHATGILYDSYRRQEHEAALEQQLFQAQKMEAVGTLAGGVAHDFNNILTVIIGFAQMALFEESGSSQWREYVARIPDQGKRAAKLIAQLLTFSRRAFTERQPLHLPPMVKETVKMLERTVPENIAIRLNISGEVAPVNADPTQMQQVLLNLCVNASHAMPGGGELILGLEHVTFDEAQCRQRVDTRPGNYVCLSVRDTGTGMTPEVQARIFEPFFTTKGVGKGTGLGLAMVYGIVKEHEGHITVYSEVGKGSEFKVYLPVMKGEETISVASAQEGPTGGTETILLVEDSESMLDVGQGILTKLGYTVLTATDGEDALRIYRAHQDEIALVLTDMVMPKMGGQELYEALAQTDPAVKVLMMSGYSLKEEVADLRAKGVKGFVQKPFDFYNLGRVVRQVLDEQDGEKR